MIWVENSSRATGLHNWSAMPAIQKFSTVVNVREESRFSGWTLWVVLSFGFLRDENIWVFISKVVEALSLHDIRLPSEVITLLVVLIKSFWYLWVTMKFLRFHTIRWITDLFQNIPMKLYFLLKFVKKIFDFVVWLTRLVNVGRSFRDFCIQSEYMIWIDS